MKTTFSEIQEFFLKTVIGVIIIGIITNYFYDFLTISKESDSLNKIQEQIKYTCIVDDKSFLERYLGSEYKQLVENYQTYKYLELTLESGFDVSCKTTEDFLFKKNQFLLNIKSQINPLLYEIIEKALNELRYDDVLTTLNSFALYNQNTKVSLYELSYIKALIYMKQREFDKAKQEFEKMSINEDEKNMNLLFNYAKVLDHVGNRKNAIKFYSKALRLGQKTIGENNLIISDIYWHLGSLTEDKYNKDNFENAIKYFNKSLKIKIKIRGENDLSLAFHYSWIAQQYHHTFVTKRSNIDKSIEYYEKALSLCERYLDHNYWIIERTSYNLKSAKELKEILLERDNSDTN